METMMTWLPWYLLIGFALNFAGTSIAGAQSKMGWRWDLISIVIWPVTLVIGFIHGMLYGRRQ